MKWEVCKKVSGDITEQLLFNRGIVDAKERAKFLHPRITDYESSFVLDNLEYAQNRILEAIHKRQKIMIYGDYDVDGICASAIVYHALKSLGAQVKPFIPHRMDHGYGLSKLGLDELIKTNSGVNLLIAVDNGIVAHEGVEYANKMGMDVIISDHHEKGKKTPKASAIVHTTEMCGSGVAWVLVKDLIGAELADNLLQLVAVGTIADVMPMVGVNRALVVEGIEAFKLTPNLGLKTLAGQLNIDVKDVTAEKIAFDLIPKMNAAGRLESAMPALRMLCFEDPWKVLGFAEALIGLNDERRLQTKLAIEEAMRQVNSSASVNVVSGEWHPGIVGLVAARLADMSNKPTLAVAINNGNSRGSARSVGSVNIIELLRSRADFFHELGGHSGAAGFSLVPAMIEPIRQWLADVKLTGQTEAVLSVDMIIEPQAVDENLVRVVDSLSPYGGGNPKPTFGSLSARVRSAKRVGDGSHLKLLIEGVDAIGFGMGDKYDPIQMGMRSGRPIDLAYRVEINEFMNKKTAQMKLVDIVVSE